MSQMHSTPPGSASSRPGPPDLILQPSDLASSISFPSTNEAHSAVIRTPTRPFLPFRRISLPSEPGSLYRESVVSVQSFDSLPEDHPVELRPPSTSALAPKSPVTPSLTPARKPRPASMMGPSRMRIRADSRRRRNDTVSDLDKAGKRRNVIAEILETERTYVAGLDLIYDHFLVPLVESLETPQPILTRTELNSVFANFIDIWNFHRAFCEALSSLVASDPNPPLAPLLAEHFPYLSLYTPFITAFPDSVASISSLSALNPRFSSFLKTQQADPKCKLLNLRDFLLTIVQRCPRYLLLLKDLVSCTEPHSDEYEGLSAVHALVSKITSALNTSLHSHTQTLLLLAIQRSTPNLPFPLISPGRTLLKKGTLLKVGREQRLREFILLSDCLIWLSKGNEREWDWNGRPALQGVLSSPADLHRSQLATPSARPSLGPRKRSKSDAELPKWRSSTELSQPSGEERWTYRGRYDLMDIEVVVATDAGPSEGRKFDIFGPTESFGVYTSTDEERDAWVQAIRSAKASLLMSLNITHPNTTLTSSASTAHLRRSLQALPHAPDEGDSSGSSPKGKDKPKTQQRRGKVEHFVPPIWVPDARTDTCMRCTRLFGLLRRRHHCRLCGRVVCAGCSNRTFYISDPADAKPVKPARACNACYDTVFPLLPSSPIASPRPLYSPTSSSFSPVQNRPSAMHIPTLPDIPSHRSLDRPDHSTPSLDEPDRPWIDASPSPASMNDPLPPTSVSLPANLPTTPPMLPSSPKRGVFVEDAFPGPATLSRPSSCTVETAVSVPTPVPEHLHQFTLPTALSPPSSYVPPGRRSGPLPRTASKSPERDDVRRHSRASLPALRDSFYKHSREEVGHDDLPPDLSSELLQLQSSEKDEAKRNRRITFAPSSAVHRAPVTIYPQKDDVKRFSLVLSGKGTVGRGAGLDIGTGALLEPRSPPGAVMESPQAGASSSNLSTPTSIASKSRRLVFEGLEKGVAAGKLNWLLRRDKKTRGGGEPKSPPTSS